MPAVRNDQFALTPDDARRWIDATHATLLISPRDNLLAVAAIADGVVIGAQILPGTQVALTIERALAARREVPAGSSEPRVGGLVGKDRNVVIHIGTMLEDGGQGVIAGSPPPPVPPKGTFDRVILLSLQTIGQQAGGVLTNVVVEQL